MYYQHRYIYTPQHRFSQSRGTLGLITAATFVYRIQVAYPKATLFLGLNPPLSSRGYVWQFVTYLFTHGGFWHLFLNMFVLYIFGAELEKLWGSREFLSYFFFSGISAGICAYIFSNSLTVGASGAIYGLLLAYGITFPNRMLLLYFFIPIRAKYLVIIFGALEFVASIASAAGFHDGIAHIAHLGGLVGGGIYIIIKKAIHRRKSSSFSPPPEFRDMAIRRQYNARVDEILDKVVHQGIESLTPEERQILIDAGRFFRR